MPRPSRLPSPRTWRCFTAGAPPASPGSPRRRRTTRSRWARLASATRDTWPRRWTPCAPPASRDRTGSPSALRRIPGSWRPASTAATDSARFSGRTAWARSLEAPLRSFLRTETGSASFLLAAAAAALVWANLHPSSYEDVWDATLSIRLGDAGVSQSVSYWVNSGLMTFFFFVVGLEARREFDLGDLRERRSLVLPVTAAAGGAALTAGIFLAINAGKPSADG